MSQLPEVWLRGPVAAIPVLLQPVVHALLQSQEEVHRYLADFPGDKLWVKPAGAASVGFHLQHLTGVADRLFTYARNQPLTDQQLEYLAKEGVPDESLSAEDLINAFDRQISLSIAYLKTLDPATLTEYRPVGRKQLPSTVLGLLFHAAEHTQRHVGALYVTVRVVKELP